MIRLKRFGAIVGLAGLVVLFAIGLALLNTRPAGDGTLAVSSSWRWPQGPGFIDLDYAYESFEWMMQNADAILVGRVMDIGETRWNQDSGAYWEAVVQDDRGHATTVQAIPYYEITLSVDRLLAGSPGIKTGQLIITVVGFSPLDHPAVTPPFHPQCGDEIVAFVRQGEIGWYRGEVTYNQEDGFVTGKKAVMRFMGGPDNSHLLRNESGLYFRPAAQDSPFSPPEELTGAIPIGELAEIVQEKRTAP